MNRNQQIVVGGLIVLGFLGMIAWALWPMLSDSAPDAQVDMVPLADAQPGRPAASPRVIVRDGLSLDLPPATRPASFIGAAPPEPRLAANEVAFLEVESLTIVGRDHGKQYKGVSPRQNDSVGLIKFDLSRLKEVPTKAVFKACAFYIENTDGYHTPVQFVFYRMKSDWDDTATYRFAKARDQLRWESGMAFDLMSGADVHVIPLGKVTVPNPPPPGYNVELDITSVVAGWVKGEYPNHGLLVTAEGGLGYSLQGNFKSRRQHATYTPRIICTVSMPVNRTAQGPVEPRVETDYRSRSFADFMKRTFNSAAAPATQPVQAQARGTR